MKKAKEAILCSDTRRNHPFQPIYDICNQGTVSEKRQKLPPFPRYLDVELTNHCNFRCLMCFTGSGMSRRIQGYLSDELYQRILEEATAWRTPLRFIRWGEPTLHPDWRKMLIHAKNAGLPIHMTTNGSQLSDEDLEFLVDLPLDSIKFSFQGVDRKSYQEMRNTDFFDQLVELIELLYRIRGTNLYPFIQVSTSTTYENEIQRLRFREQISSISDQVVVGRTNLYRVNLKKVRLSRANHEVLRKIKLEQTLRRVHTECHEVCDKLSINWDGTISACCVDHDNLMVVGRLEGKNSLAQAWNSTTMDHYRLLLAQGRHNELELCRHCFDIHGLRKVILRPELNTRNP